MDNLVLLKIYHNKYDAEAAVGLLETNGIEAILSSDISLGDNQVLVKKGDLEKAREAIKPLEESVSEEQAKQEVPQRTKKISKEKTVKLILAIQFIVVGIFISLKVVILYQRNKSYQRTYYADKRSAPAKEDGLLKHYYDSGELWQEINYVNGKPHGEYKMYHKNGQLEIHSNYINGQEDGSTERYYENGQLSSVDHFKNGLRDGVSQLFYETGELMKETTYQDGKETKNRFYDENGNLVSEDGKPVAEK